GGLALGGAGVFAQEDGAQAGRAYRVTVANLTPGQPFTPPAVAAHQPSVEVFAVGDPANTPTQELAENGNLTPLANLIEETQPIRGAAVGNNPLVPVSDPGETGLPYATELEFEADASATQLTFLSMLIATNDGITGLDTVDLPNDLNESKTYYANGYDVGTEQNTELFADLVPPAKTLILGGEPEGTTESDPTIAEDGVISPHPGIEGVGNLPPEVYDWDDPAALVQVERIEPSAIDTPTPTPTNQTVNGTATPVNGTVTPGNETVTGTATPGNETVTETATPGNETVTGTATPGNETATETGTATATSTPISFDDGDWWWQ
ncbi:MAG: spondin domain-containing protein, partial [Halobaculum sp.]